MYILNFALSSSYENTIQAKAVMYSKSWRDLKERQGRKVVSFPS